MDNNKLETISNLFEDSEIRSVWDSEKEEYYFSVVDIIKALTDSKIPKRYWTDLKRKLTEEGSQLYENIVQLKMKANDDKMRETDTLDTKGILRLIESIPSPKAEPFKLWLAKMGNDRIDEVFDPELAINRAVDYYRSRGYDDNWINARMTGVVDRRKLTDVWVRNWKHIEQLFNYGSAVRKVMYTTNAIESVNSSFRKVTKRGSFPNETALFKLLYLRVTELYKKWKDRPISNWAMVRNQIAMNSEMQARITKYENI